MKNQGGFGLMAVLLLAVWGFEACSPAKGDHAGTEYMPDMGHSIAYEANTYGDYFANTWDSESKDEGSGLSRKALTLHNLPAEGTVPRGYLGASNAKSFKEYQEKIKELRGEHSTNAVPMTLSGSVPYYIPNTEEGRQQAYTAENLRFNPLPITEKGLDEGKQLYDIYCGICHGEKGDGNGWIYDEEANKNAKYPAAPTNYLTDDMITAENGRYYHAIMYGKGVMGSYKDKLSYEERWNVIHYIRSLQAKSKKLAYGPYENSLNEWATPFVETDVALDLDKSELAKEVSKVVEDSTATAADMKYVLNNVFFKTGEAALEAKSRMELNILAKVLNKYPSLKIEIAGHTDNTGEPEANLVLSDNRANAVKAYLSARGVSESQLQAKGYGQSRPVASNDTETGRAKNRRTEFAILSK